MIDVAADTPAYRAYQRAREFVGQLDIPGTAQASPSDYWREELSGFDYLFDATPRIIEKLRQHCYHVTGILPYDYRPGTDSTHLRERLADLRRVTDDRFQVVESPELGGFGHEIDGHLHNVDTLKYFEVLGALDIAGWLAPLETGGLVWEIGAGWGGFPYQFKKLLPEVTYLVSDLPPLFLFSLPYLAHHYPDARMALCGSPEETRRVLENWRDYDFIFVPHIFTDHLEGATPDLAINMVSFQEMTTEQVRCYVERASTLGCQRLYSLNRDRSSYNSEITSVREILREKYSLRELRVLTSDYTSGAKGSKERRPDGYRHVAGRLLKR